MMTFLNTHLGIALCACITATAEVAAKIGATTQWVGAVREENCGYCRWQSYPSHRR